MCEMGICDDEGSACRPIYVRIQTLYPVPESPWETRRQRQLLETAQLQITSQQDLRS
jgi:hypothetical protein